MGGTSHTGEPTKREWRRFFVDHIDQQWRRHKPAAAGYFRGVVATWIDVIERNIFDQFERNFDSRDRFSLERFGAVDDLGNGSSATVSRRVVPDGWAAGKLGPDIDEHQRQ